MTRAEAAPAYPVREAAGRILDAVAYWAGVLDEAEDRERDSVRREPPGQARDRWRFMRGCAGGPPFAEADLVRVALLGPVEAALVNELRTWRETNGAPARIQCRQAVDMVKALEAGQWVVPRPAIPARNPAVRPGLDSLRAKHPEMLAKPGPCAVVRAMLADPDKLWSARALAKSDEVRDALPAGRASAWSVGRWLAELHAAGLACAEGKRTAKRWRLGAA